MIEIESFDAADEERFPEITNILCGTDETPREAVSSAHKVISKIYNHFLENPDYLEDFKIFKTIPKLEKLSYLIKEVLNDQMPDHKFYEIDPIIKSAVMKVCVSSLPESLIPEIHTKKINEINWSSDSYRLRYELIQILNTLPDENYEILLMWIQIIKLVAKYQLKTKAQLGATLNEFKNPLVLAHLLPFNIFSSNALGYAVAKDDFLMTRPIQLLLEDTGFFVSRFADPNERKFSEYETNLMKILLALKDIIKANQNRKYLKNVFFNEKHQSRPKRILKQILRRKLSDRSLEKFNSDLAGEIFKLLLQKSSRKVFSFPQNADVLTALRGTVNNDGRFSGTQLSNEQKNSALITIAYSLGKNRFTILSAVLECIIYVEKVNYEIFGETRAKLRQYANVFAQILFQYDRGKPFLEILRKRWNANTSVPYEELRQNFLNELTKIYAEAVMRLLRMHENNKYKLIDLGSHRLYRLHDFDLPPLSEQVYLCITQSQWDWLEKC